MPAYYSADHGHFNKKTLTLSSVVLYRCYTYFASMTVETKHNNIIILLWLPVLFLISKWTESAVGDLVNNSAELRMIS